MIGILLGMLILTAEAHTLPTEQAASKQWFGTVQVVGPALFSSCQLLIKDKGPTLRLEGPYSEELCHLQSGQILIHTATEADGALNVSDYEIIDVGGIRPYVGVLKHPNENQWLLIRSCEKPLSLQLNDAAQAKLTEQMGSKIWVHGKMLGDGRLQLTRYGILRPPAVRFNTKNTDKTMQGEKP